MADELKLIEHVSCGCSHAMLAGGLLATAFFLFCLLSSDARPLYLLPSFQGTILQSNGRHIHLAPLTPSTYSYTYSQLTHLQTLASVHAEYPTVVCAASSHAGHCKSLPGRGPISELQRKYNVTVIPYDWRLASTQLVPSLTATVSGVPKDSILFAHGTACRLATLINAPAITLVCLSPVSPDLAKDALRKGEGLLTLGDAHRYKHPGDRSVEKDFRMMEHELGLVTKKRLLPETAGPWDERDLFAAPREARMELAARIDSISEYAEGGALGNGESSLCIQGSGVGPGCDRFSGEVVYEEVTFFDLVGLVDAALRVLDITAEEKECWNDESRS